MSQDCFSLCTSLELPSNFKFTLFIPFGLQFGFCASKCMHTTDYHKEESSLVIGHC